jgi:hypothetical protein
MADKTSMFFLIQWEDRFLSVIHPNKVVQPKKSESNYKEGEIITALFGKEKYEAVICEIHSTFILCVLKKVSFFKYI